MYYRCVMKAFLPVLKKTLVVTCVMMRSPSVNCFTPNTSTIFILSVAWTGEWTDEA